MFITWLLTGIIFLLSLGILFIKIKRPQTIWLGFLFFALLFSFALLFLILFTQMSVETSLKVMITTLAFMVLLLLILVLIVFTISRVNDLREEVIEESYLILTVALLGLVLYIITWPLLVNIWEGHVLNIVYRYILFSCAYLSLLFVCYLLTSLLNLVHLNNQIIDYFIVLGAGLDEDKVTAILAGRINKALDLQKQQGVGKIIFSGGQGPDELIPEGEAMTRYAIYKGIDGKFLIKETKATNTYENIKYSKEIIQKDWNKEFPPHIAIVSNNYHVLRALLLAHRLGMKCVGYGSRGNLWFSIDAFLREFVAYLSMSYKIHAVSILVLGLAFFIYLQY